jgi:hypothetical protein
MHPSGDAFPQILAVGVEIGGRAGRQGFQRRNRGKQLHAIVGGGGLATFDLARSAVLADQRAPSARAGISRAGPIGPDLDRPAHAASP